MLYWRVPRILPKVTRPHIIEIELTNQCNMGCTHCHRTMMTRKLGNMDFETYRKLIDEIENYPIAFLRIVGQGESSLHPQIEQFLNYTRGKSIKIEFATNGTLLDKFSKNELLKMDIDILGISIDGFDESSYMSIRKGGNYNKIKKSVVDLYEHRNNSQKKYPLICLRSVIFPEQSREQIKELILKWKNNVDFITFNTLNKYSDKVELSIARSHPCDCFFFDAYIRYDGSVLLCRDHFIYGSNEIIGNIRDESLSSIWRSEKLEKIRKSHYERQYSKTCILCINNTRRTLVNSNARRFNSSNNLFVNILNKFINVT